MAIDGLDTAGFNESELAVAAGFLRGEPVSVPGAEVRASVIARVLCQPGIDGTSWPRPLLRLTGARVVGSLDLSFAQVAHPLLLEECEFTEPPRLYWAQVAFVSFRGSRLPGLIAANVSVAGHLRLIGCRIDGQVNLKGAKLVGGLLLNDAQLSRPGEIALDAERAQIGGDLLAESGLRMSGAMSLFQAVIAGGVHLDGAAIEGTGIKHGALALENVEIRGGLFARAATVNGEVTLRHGRIGGAVALSGATLSNPGGVALRMDRAEIHGGVFIHGGCQISGETRMVSAQISRTVRLSGATLSNKGGYALLADGLTTDGSLDGRDGFTAIGEVSLVEARISGPIRLEGTRIDNPGGTALRAAGIVAGAIMNCCDGFTATGRVSVTSAKITSRLCFDGARLTGEPVALRVAFSEAGELSLRFAEPPSGQVDLRHTRVGILRDRREAWPAALDLDGLTYQTMEPLLPAAQRLGWLARSSGQPAVQPYEQLAAHYRQVGDDAEARSVLLTRQRRRRASMSWPSRAWGWLQDITVGYGYRPQRAALWLAALLLVGTLSFGAYPPSPIGGQPPHFNALIYSLDLLLPVVSFGQESAFEPQGDQQWLEYLLIIAGWTLATTAAAGFTRAMSRS